MNRPLNIQQAKVKFPGAEKAWEKQTGGDELKDSSPELSADNNLRATDANGGTYGWEDGAWICPECGTTPDSEEDPSVPCHICNRGPGMRHESSIKEMGSGGGGGGGNSVGSAGSFAFQIPAGVKKRKKKVDELISLHEDINEGHVLSYFNGMKEDICESGAGKWLDEGDYNSLADDIRRHMVRELIRKRVREVVRKKAGGGGYVLYSPNQGKKKQSKAVGSFPTKMGAKKAELARFPPKDAGKLKRLRKEVDRLLKDPKKAADKEKSARKEKGTDKGHAPPPKKHESAEFLVGIIRSMVNESLFHEERSGSDWDDQISRLSKQAVSGDKKFQNLQKNIEKKTEKILQDAFGVIAKSVDKKVVKMKNFGVKKSEQKGKTYLAFGATMDNVAVEPIYIYSENGVPKIEVSDQAKVALTKVDPGNAKLFRAELVTVQERVLDKMDDLERAVQSRDKYLGKIEDDVDSFVTGLTPLQISLLKNLLVKKYRKIS